MDHRKLGDYQTCPHDQVRAGDLHKQSNQHVLIAEFQLSDSRAGAQRVDGNTEEEQNSPCLNSSCYVLPADDERNHLVRRCSLG